MSESNEQEKSTSVVADPIEEDQAFLGNVPRNNRSQIFQVMWPWLHVDSQ